MKLVKLNIPKLQGNRRTIIDNLVGTKVTNNRRLEIRMSLLNLPNALTQFIKTMDYLYTNCYRSTYLSKLKVLTLKNDLVESEYYVINRFKEKVNEAIGSRFSILHNTGTTHGLNHSLMISEELTPREIILDLLDKPFEWLFKELGRIQENQKHLMRKTVVINSEETGEEIFKFDMKFYKEEMVLKEKVIDEKYFNEQAWKTFISNNKRFNERFNELYSKTRLLREFENNLRNNDHAFQYFENTLFDLFLAKDNLIFQSNDKNSILNLEKSLISGQVMYLNISTARAILVGQGDYNTERLKKISNKSAELKMETALNEFIFNSKEIRDPN